MADENSDLSGPSCSKRRKYDNKRSLTDAELLEILEDDFSDHEDDEFDSGSDDEYVPDVTSEAENSETDDVENTETEEISPRRPVLQEISWESDSESIHVFQFTKVESLLEPTAEHDPIHYFRHILTDRYLDEIVIQTNGYAIELVLRPVFLGLLLHMGNIRLIQIQDYWKTDYLFGLGVFANNMGRNRFLLILRAMHFAQNPQDEEAATPDRLYKVRNIVNMFNTRMSEIY
ncbi:hypothetical protein JTB14_005135 [Gonioctena quinquepunctata]|nr:hypothetical protein JTB14_005135 [Gonioctena quinquepunctata]